MPLAPGNQKVFHHVIYLMANQTSGHTNGTCHCKVHTGNERLPISHQPQMAQKMMEKKGNERKSAEKDTKTGRVWGFYFSLG